MNLVLLFNDMVKHRIHDLFDQVTIVVKASKYGFTMQLDESTDVPTAVNCLFMSDLQKMTVKTGLLIIKKVSNITKG